VKKVKKRILLISLAALVTMSFVACNSDNGWELETQAVTEIHEIKNDGQLMTMHTSAFNPPRSSVDELASDATYVIRALILNEKVEIIDTVTMERAEELPDNIDDAFWDSHEVITVNSIEVVEAYKGDAEPGQIMEIVQIGGRIGDIEVISYDRVQFTDGEDLFLFLNPWGYPIHPSQSVYRSPAHLKGGSALNMPPTTILENFHIDNNLILTVGDLERISLPVPDVPTLDVGQTEHILTGSENAIDIMVESNHPTWYAIARSDWLTVERTGSMLTITTEANVSPSSRTAKIFVFAGCFGADGGQRREINVTQYSENEAMT